MFSQQTMTTLALLLLIASCVRTYADLLDIRKYGVTPNGDITMALQKAWRDACVSMTPSKIVVPSGKYKLRQIYFMGPCKAPIEVQVNGVLKAPKNPFHLNGQYQWVRFEYIDFLNLSGNGTFHGRGKMAWKQNDCQTNKNCLKLSMNLGFGFVNNSVIQDITSKDSKYFHVNVFGCKNITFTNFKVSAPAYSPNTDGIHIGKSIKVNIINSKIGTGDDCISLGDGSKEVTILNVTCGPGHGISVGSLGKYENEESVEDLIVKNCTLKNTNNGLRIKTWPGTPITSLASDLHFEDIIMINVSNPIIIDQEYCPWNQCSKQSPSKVKISKVTFKNIKGTSATQEGVSLICSSGIPCEIVVLSDIDLRFNGTTLMTAKCVNVKPLIGRKAPTCAY
ncbi:hypothetical protein VNO78_33149 [Psophocarpus tetragonolobus]|uniref:Polygalacturonase n=1 Tax=Psophocarpus tetragonolobus TaxID=3891 RepID=A0AAN9P1U8_PSOTE